MRLENGPDVLLERRQSGGYDGRGSEQQTTDGHKDPAAMHAGVYNTSIAKKSEPEKMISGNRSARED
jgi:hypothetical protein